MMSGGWIGVFNTPFLGFKNVLMDARSGPGMTSMKADGSFLINIPNQIKFQTKSSSKK